MQTHYCIDWDYHKICLISFQRFFLIKTEIWDTPLKYNASYLIPLKSERIEFLNGIDTNNSQQIYSSEIYISQKPFDDTSLRYHKSVKLFVCKFYHHQSPKFNDKTSNLHLLG